MKAILNKFWLSSLILFCSFYSFYEALNIYLTGSMDGYCKGGFDGAACHYCQKVGIALFGANQAHLGYALFLVFNGLVLVGFSLLAHRLTHRSSGRPNGTP